MRNQQFLSFVLKKVSHLYLKNGFMYVVHPKMVPLVGPDPVNCK